MLYGIIGQLLDYCQLALLNSAQGITEGVFNRDLISLIENLCIL